MKTEYIFIFTGTVPIAETAAWLEKKKKKLVTASASSQLEK